MVIGVKTFLADHDDFYYDGLVGEMLKIRMRTADAQALRERAKQQDSTVSAVVHRALGFEPLVYGGKREGAGRPVTKKAMKQAANGTSAKKAVKRTVKRGSNE